MINTVALTKALNRAESRYQNAEKSMKDLRDDPVKFQAAAQELNEAWLEVKRAKINAQNGSVMKTLGDLYGC